MSETHVKADCHVREEPQGGPKRRKRQSGLTLVEMMAVITILAIVSGVGFVVVNNQIEKARENTDKANVRTIADAVNRYIMDNGKSPGSFTVDDSDKKLVGQYLGSAPKSPWEGEGSYQVSDDGKGAITITSPHDPDGTGTQSPYSLTIKYK